MLRLKFEHSSTNARLVTVYVLIVAVLLAAVGLAYSSYTRSIALSARERHVIMDTMRELAEEKVISIESEILEADRALFNRVDIDNLPTLQKRLRATEAAVDSVLIVGSNMRIMASGFFTTRTGPKQQLDQMREFYEKVVIPDLALPSSPLNLRKHLHRNYNGRPHLFSFTRRLAADGRAFYIVVDVDLAYLVGTVFPQFFGARSPRLYQVVDKHNTLVYGFAFTGIPDEDVVDIPFAETVDQWRLRATQKDRRAFTARGSQKKFDLALIATSLTVIVAGLFVVLIAVVRERRANELKSEFISNVSHELKTPLSIISMFGEMLAMGRTKSASQATEYAEIIWRESVRLSRLIDNVLDFAKIEKGADVFEFIEQDMADVLNRTVVLCTHRLARAKMELKLDIAEGLPAVHIDANAITLAILNLVDNAIKYAQDGGEIGIRLHADQTRIFLTVSDRGAGIAADEQEAIFERFYRSRSIRLKPIRGSGIGLALVKHIAKAHHGDVKVTSIEGQGSAFELSIPIQKQG